MDLNARRVMACVGALQGLALWMLVDRWPADPRVAAFSIAATSFVLVSALVLHFARDEGAYGRLLALAVGAALPFAALAFWVGWQLPPKDPVYMGDQRRVASFVLASGIALYALGPFLQIYQAKGRPVFPYPDLYRHAWNNFFVGLLGLVYAAALWVVLLLWAALFDLVGVGFFENLFSEEAFAYPLTGAALGYGLAVGHESHRVIATLRGLTQALFRAVEPLLAAVTLGFLATLPFTGLDPLFGSTSAASVLMSWVAAHILFLNAVYLDGSQPPPYTKPLCRLIEAGCVAAPLLAAIGLYAIALRIGQHGLSPDRVFALVISALLGLYTLGYAAAVALRGEPWLPKLQAVNVGMAWLVIATSLALHTPLFDAQRLSLANQLARLRSGSVAPADFDYGFLRFELGHVGFAALQGLASEPDSAPHVQIALDFDHYWSWSQNQNPRIYERLPADAPWPEGLERDLRNDPAGFYATCRREHACLVAGFDLDGDGEPEQIIHDPNTETAFVFDRGAKGSAWKLVGTLAVSRKGDWLAELAAGRATTARPHYDDLEIGGKRLPFSAKDY